MRQQKNSCFRLKNIFTVFKIYNLSAYEICSHFQIRCAHVLQNMFKRTWISDTVGSIAPKARLQNTYFLNKIFDPGGEMVIQMFPHRRYGLFLTGDIFSHCRKNKDESNLKISKRYEVEEAGSGNTGTTFPTYFSWNKASKGVAKNKNKNKNKNKKTKHRSQNKPTNQKELPGAVSFGIYSLLLNLLSHSGIPFHKNWENTLVWYSCIAGKECKGYYFISNYFSLRISVSTPVSPLNI